MHTPTAPQLSHLGRHFLLQRLKQVFHSVDDSIALNVEADQTQETNNGYSQCQPTDSFLRRWWDVIRNNPVHADVTVKWNKTGSCPVAECLRGATRVREDSQWQNNSSCKRTAVEYLQRFFTLISSQEAHVIGACDHAYNTTIETDQCFSL